MKARFLPHEEITSPLPILSEPLSLVELAVLRLSPTYHGIGVPAGDGSAVVVVPGLLCTDLFLADLHGWLARIGYRPYFSGMEMVDDCPNLLAQRLDATIDRAYAETGGRVHLVGHSLGGIFARAAAVRQPHQIASVITLAAPFRGVVAHRVVLGIANSVRRQVRMRYPDLPEQCATSLCSCAFGRSLRRRWPRSVKQTAIYSRQDGLVHWHYCRTGDPQSDVEVHGTHIGLVFNSAAYQHIAERLAGSQERTKRRRLTHDTASNFSRG